MNRATYRPKTGFHPFTISELDGTLVHHTVNEDLCFWPCPFGHSEIAFEGFVKSDGGIRHLVHRYHCVTLHGAALDTLEYGVFSPRPYRLAQPCDGSITSCVLTLFVGWCKHARCSPVQIYQAAYDWEQTVDWTETVRFAEWQGVAHPTDWGTAEVAGLVESLHAINYHQVSAIVAHRS